jgi:RND superfamily putative drug exporter
MAAPVLVFDPVRAVDGLPRLPLVSNQGAFDQTRDNSESVAYGLRTTGGLITGAAIIMVAVFAGFAAGDLVPLQQTGFGLAIAVFIDATLVRSVLVPASMKLLGDRNWYLPRFLSWLPNVSLEMEHATPDERTLVPSPATD